MKYGVAVDRNALCIIECDYSELDPATLLTTAYDFIKDRAKAGHMTSVLGMVIQEVKTTKGSL